MLCSCSGKLVVFQSSAEAQTCMEGGCLLQTESFSEMPDKSSNPFQIDRGITSTACPVLSSIDYTLRHLSTNARNKSQAKFQRFGSKSGHQHFSKGQRCLVQIHQLKEQQLLVWLSPGLHKNSPDQCCLHAIKSKLAHSGTSGSCRGTQKLFCSNSPPQISSRNTRTQSMWKLHRAAHAAESSLFPLSNLYQSMNGASCQMGSCKSKNATCASCSPIMVVVLWADCPCFSLW